MNDLQNIENKVFIESNDNIGLPKTDKLYDKDEKIAGK